MTELELELDPRRLPIVVAAPPPSTLRLKVVGATGSTTLEVNGFRVLDGGVLHLEGPGRQQRLFARHAWVEVRRLCDESPGDSDSKCAYDIDHDGDHHGAPGHRWPNKERP
jgi:hypothetical protein